MYNDYGANDDALGTFQLSLSDVVLSAIRVQGTARDFLPRQPSVMKDIFSSKASDTANMPPLTEMLFVNITICDLTDLELTYDDSVCLADATDNLWGYCLSTLLRKACVTFSLDGHAWPYTEDQTGFPKASS
jgi:hypothetical protein